MKHHQIILAVGILWSSITLSIKLSAQESPGIMYEKSSRGWNISGAVGTSVFLGDIKTNPLLPALKDQSELRYVATVGIERRFNPWIATRGHIAYSHVLGARKSLNVHFKSFVWDAAISGLLYPVNLFAGYDEARFADFYIVAGIGAINYNTTLYQLSTGNILAQRGYGRGRGIAGTTYSSALMGGIGVDFRLSDKVDFRFEIVNKGIGNDLMDTWKSEFPFDVFNHLTFGIVYKLGQRAGSFQPNLDPQSNQKAPDVWANAPAKPIESKEVTDNLQFTPVIEIPAEPEKQVVEPVIEPEITIEPTPQPPVLASSMPPTNEFKVQIFASKKPFNKSVLAKRFKLNDNTIVESRFQKFYIYSVGSFTTMEEAMALRDKLRRDNGISDAFVTIWENGQRTGPDFK